MTPQAIREELRQRNLEHGWRFHIEVSEADALDLASGYVPNHVKAMILTMLDFHAEDARRAARPVRPRLRSSTRVSATTAGDAVPDVPIQQPTDPRV